MKEKDDFWNIDRILPKSNTVGNTPHKVETVEVTTGAASRNGVDIRALFAAINEKKSVNSFESSIEKEYDYTYFSESRVITYAYIGKYSNILAYDNRSRTYALELFDKSPDTDSEFVEYFSFKPSFSDLSKAQRDYYLFWRYNIRQGFFAKTSPSYVFLLVSEIVNLPDKIPPKEGLDLIISLFDECIDDIPKYERLISDVLFEYCVVHNLQIPYKRISSIVYKFKNPISNIIGSLFVFDYLLNRSSDFSEEELKFVFEKNLSFSYSSGKHYSENSKLAFMLDSYFYKILGIFIRETPECITQIYSRHENRASPIKVIRPTFLLINASSEIKKNLVFEYYSFDKTDVELLYLLNIAKCIENKFRGLCGIRARLTVTPLDENSRRTLDRIFDSVIPNKRDTETPVKANNKKVHINFNAAQKIEEASWETTKMLTEGIDVFDDIPETSNEAEVFRAFTDLETNVIHALIKKDLDSAIAECQKQGVFLDAVITTVNEKALDIFNDVIIDTENMSVYDDYVTDVEQLIN